MEPGAIQLEYVDAFGAAHRPPEETIRAIERARGWAAFAKASTGAAVTAALVAVTVTGFVLSLGPDGVRPLYAALYQSVFGFQAIRAPARFAVMVLFGLAGLAAIGVDELLRHGRLVR